MQVIITIIDVMKEKFIEKMKKKFNKNNNKEMVNKF